MTGFNRSHPLSDFVDAGHHKEAADSKMKANLELYYRNFHCKHIIFGGSADSSYAGFLSPFSLPGAINDRITLLEGAPFPFDLRKVAQSFRQTSFKSVFRPTKIQVLSNGTQPVTIGMKRPAQDALASSRDRPSLQAVTAVITPPKPQPGPNPQSAPAATFALSPFIFQNKFGQRLDVPLNIDREYLQFLYDKNARLCNNFYLKGHCPYGVNCEWDHSIQLNQIQLDTFRHKARTSSCRDPFCVDPQCCLGHMCPRDSLCNISQCKFLPEMHYIDIGEVYQLNTETKERKRITMLA